uniref:Uncharacterized protein n=1 Tax=Glossina austeni TaxID=7395 RepID=A0A1A9V4G6_GLOAU
MLSRQNHSYSWNDRHTSVFAMTFNRQEVGRKREKQSAAHNSVAAVTVTTTTTTTTTTTRPNYIFPTTEICQNIIQHKRTIFVVVVVVVVVIVIIILFIYLFIYFLSMMICNEKIRIHRRTTTKIK